MVISVPQTGLSSLAGQLGENPEQALDDLIRQLSIEPRSYQQRIITSAVKMFAGTYLGRDRKPVPIAGSVLIESPTGSGKTVMGLSTVALLQRATGCRVHTAVCRQLKMTRMAFAGRCTRCQRIER